MNNFKRMMVVLCASLAVVVFVPTQLNSCVVTVEAHSGESHSENKHSQNTHSSNSDSHDNHSNNDHSNDYSYDDHSNDHSADYHYCNGNPAHLHDNGVCPYGTSSSTTATSTTTAAAVSLNNTSSATTAQTVVISDTTYNNAAFDASYYASRYSDLYAAYGNDAKALYKHFVTYGINEGRQASAQFNVLAYQQNNQDLLGSHK
jgi:cytoskeletal protein RodZ